MRILIIPDKFKGTLSAGAAAEAIASGWRRARPLDRLEQSPLSDGGDGFGEVMGGLLGCRLERTVTCDAAHRRRTVSWWWHPGRRLAVIESARIFGLAMLPAGRFHPFDLDTFGLGAVLRSAATKGARECILGIGGSATNDGGFGLARALGWVLWNEAGREITRWVELQDLRSVEPVKPMAMSVRVAVDVQNPLLGARGATAVYGPQKGLRTGDLPQAEKCLKQLARVMAAVSGQDFARHPGAGAAGGLGFGLLTFCSAKLVSGFDLFASASKLERELEQADVVISGEGAVDRSTLMGKGVGQIVARCRAHDRKCVLLAGKSTLKIVAGAKIRSLTELTSEREALRHPSKWLERLAYAVASALH